MPFFSLLFIQLSLIYHCTCNVIELTIFFQNDNLYQTHEDKGKYRWEIYAWALRDVLAKTGNFKLSDLPYREKLSYEEILGYRSPN